MTSKRETGHENQRRGITATESGAMVSHMLVWTNGLRNCWSDTALGPLPSGQGGDLEQRLWNTI